MIVKTAVSLPDKLFRQAETAARKLKVSRSQLYANAIEEYLKRRKDDEITAKLNEILAHESSELDPGLERAQWEAIGVERW